MKFKVGDKVRLSGYVDMGDDDCYELVKCDGLVGTVSHVLSTGLDELPYRVTAPFPDGVPYYWMREDQLELVTEEPLAATLGPGIQIGDVVQLKHGGPCGTVVDIKTDCADGRHRGYVSFGYTQEFWPLVCLRKVPDVLP